MFRSKEHLEIPAMPGSWVCLPVVLNNTERVCHGRLLKDMAQFARKIILNSKTEYSAQHDQLLYDLIDAKVLLFCTVGKDCELWHDIMDEMIVGDGSIERDFDMITTWHTDETLEEVLEFTRVCSIDYPDNETVQIIEVST